ncbi:peptide ABC transporter substrate-binding protein [Bradyrhizobium sacchari]|uniref:Peptide/nickel transport system substrate-binding protein n=1 Tax=Bradyrhizobium sacchari TaxID=1399419 RepID=A0A560KCL4_9BRAD|nr:ABC transporter substrate-binding protein [Bradyrhizobium sacchari]OPZ00336.1 peptide ABC transporter substrate-binding protein [Bradyrhizobium sacchari]TWB64741.1 peptide/nickel transport system substrate-binding protein [Bradyrhizobium sacchari]TWB81065.1 peptide/nickel transport system substrate-binding protein [Bradyrhizobium sacchari]
MPKRVLLGLLLACGLTAPALAQEPKTGGVINAVIQPEPPGLMLAQVQNGPVQMVSGNIFEGLLRYSPKLEPLPELAESWSVSEDAKTYTFKLKKGVTWHDGKPFTAADVLFSMEMLKQTHARARTNLAQVDKIETPDDYTVVFTLKQPFGPFLGIFEVGSMPMVPKHLYEGTDWKTNPYNNAPVGTGPFMFKEWQKGSFIRLVKNPNYHEKGKPYLDEIYWQIIPDAAARSVAYETGKVDVLPGGSVENFDVPRLSKLKDTCVTGAGWEFFSPLAWLWLNNRQGPLADKRVRQAIMYAIDRDFAKDVIWNGLGKVATGPSSSAIKYYTDDVKKYPYDPAKAKALLKEAGYKGEKIRLLPLAYGETWQRWGEAVKQNLQDVGMTIETIATDVAGGNQKIADWDYDIAFTYLYQYGDPALGVGRNYISSNIAKGQVFNNVEGYSNPEIDKLFADGATATPDSKRKEIYDKAQKILVEDVPVAWMLELQFPTITRCKVKNLITTGIGVNDGFKDAWLDK